MKTTIGRRKFLQAAGAVALGLASPSRAACPRSAPVFSLNRRTPSLAELTSGRQPNILLIITDQERWAGNLPSSLVRPHFDRLRKNAAGFDSAFCAYPLCSPSRSSIFSGLFPHQNGVTYNLGVLDGKRSLSRRSPHLGSVLGSAGYRVGFKGKWDLSRGPRSWLLDNRDRGRAGDYGFEGHCGRVPDQEYGYRADEQVVSEACAWLRQAGASRDRPWFLCCSIINPHDICHPSLKPDQSIRTDVVLPVSLHEDLASKPKDQRVRRRSSGANPNEQGKRSYAQYTDDDWKRFLSFYYDLIEGTDRLIGRLLASLDEAELTRDTIIVYTSDHGEMGGVHGFHGKYELYEQAAHVPLYFHHPGLAPITVESLVTNVSIAPTLASLAGAEWPSPVAGQDLSPFILGNAAPGSDAVFMEHETFVDYGLYRDVNAARAIRTRQWKLAYSFYDIQDGELYDLERDPMESNNLFHDPGQAGIRRELMERLLAWQKETWDRACYALPKL